MKLQLSIVLCTLCTPMLLTAQVEKGYEELNGLAVLAGADKSSQFHNYTEFYWKYFEPMKNEPIKFLEIGIDRGYGVRLWESYFSNAELHFIDITLSRVEYFSERSHFHLVNQENPKALRKFVKSSGGDFDVILDDGGHTMRQQITSFKELFPQVKSGGIYIIEDLHTSYWQTYRDSPDEKTTISFLKDLIDDLNFVGAHTSKASHQNLSDSLLSELNLYQKQIESMHFYDSVVIIKKR